MVKCNSIETPNIYSKLNDQQQFRVKKSMNLKIILLQRLKREN